LDQTVRWIKTLAALLVCMSMIAGMLVTLPYDAAAAPPDGYIEGNVNDGVNPLPDSVVVVMPMYGSTEIVTWTDALGYYSIAVPGGLDYGVLAFNDSCYGEMAFVSVLPGEVSYLNFSLENISPAVTDVTVMGFVYDELGSPMVDTLIGVYTADPATMGDGPPLYINMSRTDGTGMFVADVLPSIAGGGVAAVGVPGYPMSDNQTEDPFVSGQTYWINLTLQPFSFDNDAAISGTVTDSGTGLPIQDVMVMVESWNESTDEGSTNMTWTESDGTYLMDIESGWVRVVMSKPGYTMYMQENIEVLPGETAVVDAELRATNAMIRGNVTDRDSGSPVTTARVFIFDTVNGTMNMAFPNGTGFYALAAFDGVDLFVGAQADGYGGQYMTIDVNPGDELWIDFELGVIDASVSGVVTDVFSGMPVADASVHFWSPEYEDWDNTDPSGAYDMNLVSGDYSVEVNSPSHRYQTFNVTISPGPNIVDISLIPWDLPETVRLYGYVNDSSSGTGIDMAYVDVGIGPPDYSERNSTSSAPSGYYEIYIPPIEMIVVVSAGDHTHVDTVVDASIGTAIRMDFVLDPDLWSPNSTYAQMPTENVSWTNPAWMHASAQEVDAKSLALWQFMKNGSVGGFSYFYTIEALYTTLNPLDQSGNNLAYSEVGDSYIVDYMWFAQPMCGWLTDGVSQLYLPYYEAWMGPDSYSGLRGEYTNSSLAGPEQGNAWFDSATGEFQFFTFDNWSLSTATPADPTGTITVFVNSIRAMDGSELWWWEGTMPMGDWSVVDLLFLRDWTAPSGEYGALFFVNDWTNRGAANFTRYTVDNDPPVADAGPGMQAVVDTTIILNGSMSSDNVGISTYRWNFDDGGPVELYGETVPYDFTTLGNHTVTLTVWDGAGHSDSATTWVVVLADDRPVADAGPDQEVAIDTVVDFDGTGSSDDVGIVNYTWTIVELTEYMWGPMPQFTFAAPGVYNVSLVVEDSIGQLSDPDTMQVTARDVTDPVADAGPDQTEMGGVEVILSGAGSSDDVGIVNWTWTFEYMGSPVELYGETVNFTFWVEGVYDITLNVTDAAGNWDTDVVQITIAGMIPEFPSVMLPVMGMVALLLFAWRRRRPN